MQDLHRSSYPVIDFAIADDLTGAVEAAALLGRGAGDATVLLADPAAERTPHVRIARNAQNGRVRVIDLDVRHATASAAHAAMRRVSDRPDREAVFVKIDSLLRGSPGSLVAARAAIGPAVVCPALPVAGRTTVGGLLRVATGPTRYDGTDLRERLRPAEVRSIGLADVRGSRLRELIVGTTEAGRVAVCDAETDADLDRVAAAVLGVPGISVAGSGGLAAAFGRLCGHPDQVRRPLPLSAEAPVLAVVGSAERSADAQADRWEALGGARVRMDPGCPDPAALGGSLAGSLAREPVTLTVDITAGPDERSEDVASRLAAVVAAAIARLPRTRLFLTGGHTARGVLDALGVRALDLVAQLDVATVHCRAADGRDIVTRPGSIGGPDALLGVFDYLGHAPGATGAPRASTPTRTSAPAGSCTEGRL